MIAALSIILLGLSTMALLLGAALAAVGVRYRSVLDTLLGLLLVAVAVSGMYGATISTP